MATPKNILDGIRVLDFSQALAGPTTTRLMAEMGAEVIKVELAPNGEASRALPYLRNGRSGYYIQQNRGKKSIAIERKDPRSIELLLKVLEKCDVLVENFAPGAKFSTSTSHFSSTLCRSSIERGSLRSTPTLFLPRFCWM